MEPILKERLARREVMLERVRSLLIEKLRVPRAPDEIDPDAMLFGGGLALDSIDAVDLLVHLSADFGIEIPSDREGRATMRTVNCLVDSALEVEENGRAHA